MIIFVLVFCGSVAASEQNSSTTDDVSGNYSSNQASSHNEGPSNVYVRGYWINNVKSEYNTVSVSALKRAGITDVFINTNKQDVNGTLKPYINKFSGSGIRVHAWIVCFKDSNGKWYDPGTNPTLRNQLTSQIISISTNYNVSGIHLDYVRYPGNAYKYNGTTHVTSFVHNIYNQIQIINNRNTPGKHHILLSAALMPETNVNAYYYGQDYGQLAYYLDFMVPMVYKGNYNRNSSWIASTTQYIVNAAHGTPVVVGLQTYRSDNYPIPIPKAELQYDKGVASRYGSAGYVLFKYGLTDTISGIPVHCTTDMAKILAAAASVKNYIEKYEKPPSSVYLRTTIGTSRVDMPTFLYLLSRALININSGNTGSIRVVDYNNPSNPSETVKSGGISKTEYIKIANNILSYMNANGKAPNSASSSLGSIPYKNLIYAFSKTIIYYQANHRLPSSIYIKTLSWPRIISTVPRINSGGVSRTSPITITFDDRIAAGANFSKIYVKNLTTGRNIYITRTISGNTLTIKTSTKSYNTTYQVYLPAGSVKNNIGNNFVNAASFKFTTQLDPIRVIKTSPANNAVNRPTTTVFRITFNTNIKAGSKYWIELLKSGDKAVSFTRSINGNVLTIKPNSNLAESRYTLILHTGCVTNMIGNPLALSRFTFSVGTPPKVTKTYPVNNTTNFSLFSSVKIYFNENIRAGTNYSRIYIKNLTTGKKVSITKTIIGRTLILKTKSARSSKNRYQVYLPTRVVNDAYGNTIVSPYTFIFRTH